MVSNAAGPQGLLAARGEGRRTSAIFNQNGLS
eukprot:CAMPEP_0179328814 /NCGR_PEP_ID=MMETSP0797-20121207/62752_1 /TAXON_ID=47934 /ORGANISM="Dinophysis acuminata, Strain DAEP01" /LENGTH=31 /DNA_ID= /DNA_START= /DNA_END= /DNA_ORIENTATION=